MNHLICGERVNKTAQASPSCGYPDSQGSVLCKVLGHYGGRADKTDAHSDAVADALAEDELPNGLGEGRCDVGASE